MDDKNNEMTYSQALAELEGILSGLRGENCDVDTLASRTRRAAELLAECRRRLTRTEEDLTKVLEELDNAIDA